MNPLLALAFCPPCLLSGLFALGATGTITLPAVMGVAPADYLGPLLFFGGFFAWLAWGKWSRDGVAFVCEDEGCRARSRARSG